MTVPHLTREEQELVAHCIREKTYAGLARKLGVSPKVAKRRRLALYQKLGVVTQKELFSVALQSGMITVQVPTGQLKE